MADDKPIDTGKKTVTGRTIWRDPETGEDYSERSTTFEIDGVYYTMPTVAEDGLQYTDDQIRDYVKKYGASDYLTGEELPEFKSQEDAIKYAISRSATRKQKEEPMLQEQMQQFNEGGLRDEGGMVDEESGNEVPIGSTRKEVRDDIPAQVSEGEFVFPADVVRFLGLEKLMEMRQGAKMGLKQMEAMGQMGNSDEATVPDDMPFGMADLVVIGGSDKEPQEKAQGGLFLQSGGSIRMPDFDFSNQDVRIYVKEGSPDRRIPFFDGEPVIPIPAGYVLKGSAPVEEETETEKAIPTGSDRDPTSPFPDKTPFQEAGGWNMEFGDPPDAAKVDLWIKEAEKTTGNAPMIMTGVGALFGGLPAAFIHGANKWNASSRDANLERVLKAAGQTTTKGQVDALNKIKADAAEGADKSLLSKAIEGVKNLLGISEEETKTITKTAIDAGDSTPKPETPEEKALREQRAKDDLADKKEFKNITREADTFAIAKNIPKASDGFLEDMDVRQMQDDDADRDPFRFSPSSQFSKGMAEDAAASVATGQTDAALVSGRESKIPSVPTSTIKENIEELKFSNVDVSSIMNKQYDDMLKEVYSGVVPIVDALDKVNPKASETIRKATTSASEITSLNPDVQAQMEYALSAEKDARNLDGTTNILDIVAGSGVDLTKKDKDSIQSVTSSSRKDRDPTLTVPEQMQQDRAFNKKQTKGSGNVDLITDRAEKAAIKQEIDAGNTNSDDITDKAIEKAKQTVKGQETGKGYVGGSGFKKGGLASRRK